MRFTTDRILRKPTLKQVYVLVAIYYSSPQDRCSIHHDQSQVCTCVFLEAVCQDTHYTHHNGMTCLCVS